MDQRIRDLYHMFLMLFSQQCILEHFLNIYYISGNVEYALINSVGANGDFLVSDELVWFVSKYYDLSGKQ
jgi:hypothetical protein